MQASHPSAMLAKILKAITGQMCISLDEHFRMAQQNSVVDLGLAL